MLKVCEKPEKYSGLTMKEAFEAAVRCKGHCLSTREKIDTAIDVIKSSPIDGCITGSCWLPDFDPDGWGTKPDVDIFVFGEDELVRSVNFAMYALKMTPGKGTFRSKMQEEWKLERLMKNGLNYKIGITTYTFYYDGIMLNFTFKQKRYKGKWYPILSTPDVLSSFDMSIVMQGYDIQSHVFYDMRVGDPKVAIANPLRDHDCVMWTVAKWVRQFDRVVKYYQRGYDTRPVAQFYIDMIDKCIAAGCLFDSEESQTAFETFSNEFVEKRACISEWLEQHEED